ncbi:MAG: transporter substrate-binding protein [Hyphomicrobiales bacterium]|nr:transporter substrate-binding protein [Hyphomicrobiales bacterium]
MKTIVVSTFPNAKALPLWIAASQGFFAARGLDVELDETESSKLQRERLAAGTIHIAQAAVDNALSMITDGLDVMIVMGGESGMNDFIVQPEITSFEDLRGKTLVVDAPDTAYALLARKMLAQHGLTYNVDYKLRPVGNASRRLAAMIESHDNAGGVLNPPFSAEAQLRGMRSLGRLVDHLGPYQAGGAFVLRSWAEANRELLESYMAAYIEALRWLRDPANGAEVEHMLANRLGLTHEIATATRLELLEPAFGFAIDARLDKTGFDNVLSTRAATEGEHPRLADVRTFIDESYYDHALASLDAQRPS